MKFDAKLEISKILSLPLQEATEIIHHLMSLDSESRNQELLLMLGDAAPEFISKFEMDSEKPKKPLTEKSKKPIMKPKLEKTANCECLGTIHALLDNCLNCGRIICDAEESEADLICPFCKEIVWKRKNYGKRKERIHVVNSYRGTIDGKQEIKRVDSTSTTKKVNMFESVPEFKAAVDHKNTLIQMDQNSAERRKIFDAAEDYNAVQNDIWLTISERAHAMKQYQLRERKLEESKRNKMTLDLQTGKLIEDTPEMIQHSNESLIHYTNIPHESIPMEVEEDEMKIVYIPIDLNTKSNVCQKFIVQRDQLENELFLGSEPTFVASGEEL